MLDNDDKLNNWIFERARDLIHTLVLISNNKIDEKLVNFTIDKLYFPCRAMEISKIYIEVPKSFEKRVSEYVQFYKKEYRINPKFRYLEMQFLKFGNMYHYSVIIYYVKPISQERCHIFS